MQHPFGSVRERGSFAAKPTLPNTHVSDWVPLRGVHRTSRRVTADSGYFHNAIHAHRKVARYIQMMWHDYSVIERTVLVPPYVLTVAAGSAIPSAPALRFSPVDETETLTRVLRVTMNILVNEPVVSWWRAAVVARLVTIGSQDLDMDIHKLLPEEVRRSFRQHGVYLLDESNEVAFCFGAFRPDFVSTTSGTPSVIFRALKKTFASVERRRHLSMRPFSSLEFWSRLQQERDDCDAADGRAVAFAALREERMARASVAAHGGACAIQKRFCDPVQSLM